MFTKKKYILIKINGGIFINYFDCINEIMIRNKNTLSVRWLGVFSTVKKLVEKRQISPYKNVNFTGEIELSNRKKVQIRCCSKDTKIAKVKGCLCLFDKIQPQKFDYLVCVYLDKYFNVQGHYIFSKAEVTEYFQDMIDVNGKVHSNCKALYIPLKCNMEEPLGTIVDNSFENWEKVK